MRDILLGKIEKLKKREVFKTPDLELLLIETYGLLDSDNEVDYNLCLAIICHVADLNPLDLMVQQLLYDCIIKSRIFLYDNLLRERINTFNPNISFQDVFAKNFYTSSKTNTILTKPQKEIFDLFQRHKRLIVSAPTSFGKTRIIREIIAHNNYRNIVLIMPTVSLLSEQFQDLKNHFDDFTISKSSKVHIQKDRKYILILTPERTNVFFEENKDFKVDFFVMDEIYKADYKLEDGRFRVFADILYKLAKTDADFYLIGPYITDFSKKFRDRFKVEFKVFNLEIVQKDYFHGKGLHKVGNSTIKIIGNKFTSLLRLLSAEFIDGKFLVYRCTKQLVEETAKKLVESWPVMIHNEELVSYLSETVSPEWNLLSCLKRGVAFHHGAMPRYIQELIVDEFNDISGGVKCLFCTTSLTEGVNTSAKNVVLYDKKVGRDPLNGLDKKNIEGRAGRFMKHFVGRVFHLEEIDETLDETDVEMEYFDDPNPASETLMQIDDSDLTSENLIKKDDIRKAIEGLGIPYNLIKQNKFVSIDGQISLIKIFRSDEDLFKKCFFEGSFPTIEVVKIILPLIYNNLFSDKDKGRDFNEGGKNVLLALTDIYLYRNLKFSEILNLDIVKGQRKNINSRIRYSFNLVSKYFEFVWPRYLKAFQNLYNFEAEVNNLPSINLDMVIAKLEYGSTEAHEIILKDAGVPNEIIKKISPYFKECLTFEDVQSQNKKLISVYAATINRIEGRILKKYI